ncbi:MAG: Atxe2 family lasso peptide isopeptidase [Candidatus Sphingomonas colombiensis]|nr:Atxe2 family lasso peptide isopeptidase [Sphingomonas sp.]WEK43257.1 MAG: Atxe2 family lasso peptide isopeptidase [Sphingomonas sp.]
MDWARSRRSGTAAAMLACGLPGLAGAVTAAPQPTITDLVETKQIDSLSVSPDGTWVAFRVIARSVASNNVTGQWYIQRISGAGMPMPMGHAFTPSVIPLMGIPKDGVSQWAPDSAALYTLVESSAGVQVHRLTTDKDIAVTSDAADVEAFTLSADGRALSYQVRNPRAEIERDQIAEKTQGIHLDRSIITDGLPLTDNFRIGGRTTTLRRVGDEVVDEAWRGDLRQKEVQLDNVPVTSITGPASATPSSVRSVQTRDAMSGSALLPLGSSGSGIILRQLVKANPDGPFGTYRVEAQLPDGRNVVCDAAFCTGSPTSLRQVTFNARGTEIVLLSEPDFRGRTAIEAWNPRTGKTRTIRPEKGALDGGSIYSGRGCEVTDKYLLCVESGPTRPPRLLRIDLDDGSERVLADPNTGLASKHFPRTQLIEWKDGAGRPWNGILVLPDGAPRERPPLVITTYRCRGFLQGGTAWLAPEFILAQQGIAALCMNTNNDIFAQRDARNRIIPMQPYKDILAAYRIVIDDLASRGMIDDKRVGISGHSFSANAATYAVSHSRLFRAAVIGSGPTIDPGTYSIVAPAADSWRKAVYEVIGLPKPLDDPDHIWEKTSPALNAHAVDAAILMQPPESEYLFCLQQYAFLQDAGKDVDMFVYPSEGHMASGQPIHQYWRNKRSVDWFIRWLTPTARPGTP